MQYIENKCILAAFLAFSAACSSGPGTSGSGPNLNPPAAGARFDSKASFAAVGSAPILQAAMQYPRAMIASEPEPPISLTASDGTGLAIESLEGKAVIEGPLAFTELELQFRNPHDRVIEGRFSITLPQGATVSRLAMRLDSGWQEAEMVERQAARRAYEDFLHRRQDPALLEKAAGNEFSARIFPIPARGVKDIIISYSHDLVGEGAVYRLPLRGLPEIKRFSMDVMVGESAGPGRPMTYRAVAAMATMATSSGFVPDRDVEVPVPAAITGMRNGEYVSVRVRPALSANVEKVSGLAIAFDTSASRAPGFAGQVTRLGELIEKLASIHGPDMPLAVATFDQWVAPIYRGPIGGFGRAELDAVLARRPLGASDLGAALAWAGAMGEPRVVVVSDAIVTAGAAGGDELRAAAKNLDQRVQRIDVVVTGGIRDESMAGRVVRGTRSRDGVVLDGALPIANLARRISQTTASGIQVKVPGAEWVWPQTLDGVQPGDEVLVFAALAGSYGDTLKVSLTGPIRQSETIPLTPVARPLIERAAVGARIARLQHERDAHDPTSANAKQRRAELEKQIVALSTRYRVLSDFTALLVLESEADYDRYGIDRRGLADILSVGQRGIEVLQRAKPVLMIAEDPAEAPRTDKPETKAKKKPDANGANGSPMDLAEGMAGKREAFKASEAADKSYDFADTGAQEQPAQEEDSESIDTRQFASGTPADDVRGRVQVHDVPARRPASPAAEPEPRVEADADGVADDEDGPGGEAARIVARPPPKPEGPPPYSGKLAEVMKRVAAGQTEQAVVDALAWRSESPGDVMALVALGEALEARGHIALAARAYGSIIDLFPARADMRRFAGERLERLGESGAPLAADSFARAVSQRPDHLTGHRLLGYALLRQGKHAEAFAAIEAGLSRQYPGGRFDGGDRILREDLGLIAAAWLARQPGQRAAVLARLQPFGVQVATTPSLRFVLYWETDANDVDFHIYDGRGGHAYYSDKVLPSGGQLYADVTTGYGPECFTIEGKPQAFPYNLQIHYYSRGPMGYGMGKLEVVWHDGAGNLQFEQRPYVVMNDGAYVDLGTVSAAAPPAAQIAAPR